LPSLKDDLPEPRPAVSGVNHVILYTNDMERALEFYCGLLGLRPRAAANVGRTKNRPHPTRRLYFLEMPQGSTIGLVELEHVDVKPPLSYLGRYPAYREENTAYAMDHLCFDVASEKDLLAIHQRLQAAGVEVTPIDDTQGSPFIRCFYFKDPDGIPLELGCFVEPATQGYTDEDRFVDTDPVPYLKSRLSESVA
jgi:catechol 2,3-dioxygenase-like lactoylglutathione lyase family enzyme